MGSRRSEIGAGVHPVLAAALGAAREEDRPEPPYHAARGQPRLRSRSLLVIASRAAEIALDRVPRGQRAEMERIARLVARRVAAPEGKKPVLEWGPAERDLCAAAHLVGGEPPAVRAVQLAAEVAKVELMGGGREASRATADVVHETMRALDRGRDPAKRAADVRAFLVALDAWIVELAEPR